MLFLMFQVCNLYFNAYNLCLQLVFTTCVTYLSSNIEHTQVHDDIYVCSLPVEKRDGDCKVLKFIPH